MKCFNLILFFFIFIDNHQTLNKRIDYFIKTVFIVCRCSGVFFFCFHYFKRNFRFGIVAAAAAIHVIDKIKYKVNLIPTNQSKWNSIQLGRLHSQTAQFLVWVREFHKKETKTANDHSNAIKIKTKYTFILAVIQCWKCGILSEIENAA